MSRGTALAAFGTRPEVLVHQTGRLGDVEIAGDDDGDVRRHVIGGVEVADVGERGGVQILHASDYRVAVWVNGEGLLVDDLVQAAVGLILDAHPPLFLHYFALAHERVLLDPQRGHAIGLHPQHEREELRRHRLPEHGGVFVGVGVGLSAHGRDDRGVLLGLDVLRALEHQVLEEVRESRAAGLLVLGPDVKPQLHVDDRRRAILVEDHRQAVGQLQPLVDELGRP